MEIVSKLIQLLPCITSKILVGLLIGVILFYIIRLILPEQVKNLDPIATAEKTYAGFQEFFEPSAISTFFGLDTTEKTDAGFQEFVEPGEKSKFLEPSAITIKKDASSKELFKHEFIHPDFDELIEPIGNSEYPESSLLKESVILKEGGLFSDFDGVDKEEPMIFQKVVMHADDYDDYDWENFDWDNWPIIYCDHTPRPAQA